jgi:transcription elongation factor SPT5
MEKDVYTILDPFGNQLRIKPQQIQFKRDSTRAVTSDVNGRPVSQKDDVIVLDDTGINKKKATVLHVYRSSVYLQAKEIVDASGVFVTKSNNVSIISNKTSIPNQPIFAQPIGRPRGRDNLIDKTVTITGGAFKGYLGIVKDTTETTARVELHTHNRTITIDKTKLNVIGGQGSTSRPDYRSEGNRYGYEARTPMHGSGAKTPAHPADAWNSGSRTPAWNSGSKTPAWDSGSKTPAWDSGSKTPAWESGSRTPAWDSGSRTPARNRFPETPTAATPMDNPNTPYSTSTPAPYTPATTARYPSMNSVGPTPHTPYDHSTPMNPTTPAATDYLKEESRSSWITDGILVKIVSGKYSGQIGSCTMVDGAKGTISLSNGETSILMEDQLKPVLPQKRDSFKVLSGEYRGNIGNLLSIDGDEGVVKIEGNDEILMLQLNTLAKIIK